MPQDPAEPIQLEELQPIEPKADEEGAPPETPLYEKVRLDRRTQRTPVEVFRIRRR